MSAPRNRASGQVRIISGNWRGRKLPVLYAEGLRPTTDRTKETVFNWLMNDVRDSRCLDAFAGSGSLGFEALSRGAKELVFVEQSKSAANNIKQNIDKLGAANAQVICGDSLSNLAQHSQPFDLVFIDPPFNKGLLQPMVEGLLDKKLLNNGAFVYVEHETNLVFPLTDSHASEQLSLHKEKTTSQFRYALYQYSAL